MYEKLESISRLYISKFEFFLPNTNKNICYEFGGPNLLYQKLESIPRLYFSKFEFFFFQILTRIHMGGGGGLYELIDIFKCLHSWIFTFEYLFTKIFTFNLISLQSSHVNFMNFFPPSTSFSWMHPTPSLLASLCVFHIFMQYALLMIL